jgi:rod shape determining protein RodA
VNLASPTEYLNVFKPTTRTQWDLLTPLALAGLGLFGLAFIYSAQLSAQGEDWIKQLIFLGLGTGVYLAVSLIDYRFWLSVAHWFYAACLLPLVLVLFLNNGQNLKWGAHRWIDLGYFSFQPSETAKIAVLLVTASLLVRSKIGTVTQSLGTLGKLALAVGAPMILILKQPDLKSAIVLPPMVFSMLYVSRLSARFFAGALGAFALLLGLVTWDIYNYKSYIESHNYLRNSQANTRQPVFWSNLTFGKVYRHL